ncbi:MAG: hypothetical protein SNG59_07765 [Rikenellaceae bacterium]
MNFKIPDRVGNDVKRIESGMTWWEQASGMTWWEQASGMTWRGSSKDDVERIEQR